MLTFGAIEFGIGFNQKANLEAGTRAGARIGATLVAAQDSSAPFTNLTDQVRDAVNASLKSGTEPTLEHLYVYKFVAGFDPQANCTVANDCTQYDPLAGDPTQFGAAVGGTGWQGGTAHRNACPPPPTPPDEIGVKIVAHYDFIAGFFLPGGGTVTMTSTSTLQFEPNNC